MAKRKIHSVTVTVYVEQDGRPALPTRQEIADGIIDYLTGSPVGVVYGTDAYGNKLGQTMKVIGAYSNLASNAEHQKGPELGALRLGTFE